MKTLLALAAAAVTMTMLAPTADAASFNCYSSKLTYTERTICDNPKLSGMDDVMAQRYFSLMNSVSKWQGRKIQRDQLRWLGSRNACGANVGCIAAAYRYRMGALGGGY